MAWYRPITAPRTARRWRASNTSATNGTVTLWRRRMTSKTFTVRVDQHHHGGRPGKPVPAADDQRHHFGRRDAGGPVHRDPDHFEHQHRHRLRRRDLRHQRAFRQSAVVYRQFERPPLQHHQRPDDRPLRHHQRHRRGRHQLCRHQRHAHLQPRRFGQDHRRAIAS